MKQQNAALLAAGLALAACEPAEQTLPFDYAGSEVTRTVTATGGTVSTPQGASVQFPSGSLASSTPVTLAPVPQTAPSGSGTPVGTASFRLSPEGTALQQPAAATLRLADGAPRDAWLASLVNLTPSGTEEIGAADVDLSTGMVRAEIGALGTLTAVIPEPAAVVRATYIGEDAPAASRAGAEAAHFPATRALTARCGEPGNRCALRVQVSSGLRDVADSLAVVYPRQSGAITISGATATGEIRLEGTLRARVGKTGDGTPFTLTAQPTSATVVRETAGEVVLTNVRVTGSGAGMHETAYVELRVRHTGAAAEVRIDRSDIRVGERTHAFGVVLPLVRS